MDRLLLLADLVEPDRRVTLPLPTPIGVVLIPDALPADPAAATTGAAPASDSDDVSLAQAYSSLCTYIRDGCQLPVAAACPSPASAAAPLTSVTGAAEGGFCVVQSFHSSMSKQLKHCSRALDDRAADEQLALVLLLGSAEQAQQAVVAKDLTDASQTTVPLADLAAFLRRHVRRDGKAASSSSSAAQDAPPSAAQPLTFRMLRDAYRQ